MSRLTSVCEKIRRTFDEEGAYWVAEKGLNTVKRKTDAVLEDLRTGKRLREKWEKDFFVDVMFVNGCDYSLPHPIRYRVDHQMEQLEAAGLSCFRIDAWNIADHYARNARVFIVYRCPYTEEIGRFIELARSLNKRVLFDIDDLVIDTSYTDDIPFIQNMTTEDKALYDDGVNRMRKTMLLCDGVITTTEGLADELSRFMAEVFINRNCASDTMLKLSEEAVYRRDVLPFLPEDKVPRHMKKIRKIWKKHASRGSVIIGYFSGSITHNDDFEQLIPVLARVLEKHPFVMLMVVGELTIPAQLEPYASRIMALPFCSWTKLPGYIARCDINIVPLMDTVFNNAKSENKWVEASLVKVPTIASDVGPFSTFIDDGENGMLCHDAEEWAAALDCLIEDPCLRQSMGQKAFEYCKYNCVTIYNTLNIRRIIESAIAENVAFVMPNLNISGGVLVALKHGSILRKNGYDVSFLPIDDDMEWIEYDGARYPVLDRMTVYGKLDKCPFRGKFDKLVATLWDTLDFIRRYPNVAERMYLVQGFEIDFNQPDSPLRIDTAQTYQNIHNVTYLTISKWCLEWLRDRYGVTARFAPNGLDVDHFYPEKRDFADNRIRILIEGDCGMKEKNVDEAFAVTNQLDPSVYEIWYMNYTGKTKPGYRIDKNLGAIDSEQVPNVYRSCHILLKTSKNESFSFPPLEMMATGGHVVVLKNEGNAEYIRNGENCLAYDAGNIDMALKCIEEITRDAELRERLYDGGIETAHKRSWEHLEADVLRLYE